MQLLSEFEIQYLSPVHHNYPAWPGGERWLQLYQASTNTQVVITKGLSNGENRICEIYLETNDEINAERFSNSWQANLVYELGKILPNVPDFAQRMEKNKYLTVQIEVEGVPPEWSLEDENGNIGLFIGLQNTFINEFFKPSIPLNIKLMRPQELLYSIQNDYSGRLQLAELYLQKGDATISNLERGGVMHY